ncbi:hypothetical protein [Helicobacter sp. MIT 14-3879]|uniref:hypothetical protein n=1 Tax=Helicobacter sp. MIT 14-3879 TaxID=2040649 RepID=UPI000E1FAB4F|nr:hypothetical protein [Helicobacter sp. MIT 14-3879]RDU61862.1 hypothetical protein CQA44_08005 [Helicobacter sp. MIT 14-3879]
MQENNSKIYFTSINIAINIETPNKPEISISTIAKKNSNKSGGGASIALQILKNQVKSQRLRNLKCCGLLQRIAFTIKILLLLKVNMN